jgi:hypothetical protein
MVKSNSRNSISKSNSNKSTRKTNVYSISAEERALINKRAKLFDGIKKIPTVEKAISNVYKKITRELKTKKRIDTIDIDRILGEQGFSFSEKQKNNLLKNIFELNGIETKRKIHNTYDGDCIVTYIIK